MIDLEGIKNILPHREPMLMVDRVIDLVEGDYIVAEKTISEEEYFIKGHFPKMPIVPGVIIVEAIGQVSGILIYKTAGLEGDQTERSAGFAGVDKCRFRSPVFPNETMTITVKIDKMNNRICKLIGSVSVEGMIVTEANLTMVNNNPLNQIMDKY